jgi:hypothetical protein
MRALAFLLLFAGSAGAVPVVPQFRTGTQTSNTRSTTQVVENIKSVDFASGYTYSISGTGVTSSGALIPQSSTTQNVTMKGVQSQWQGLPLSSKPTYQQQTQGAAFQLTEHYSGPGLQTITTIQRTTTVETVTDSTSVFGP